MNTLKILVVILTVSLIASIGLNTYFVTQTSVFSSPSTAETQLEMTQILSQAQMGIDAELKQIGDSLIYASQQLSTTGISGDQARAIVHDLALNSSFIIDAATQDTNNTMIIVEPSQYQSSEGKNIGEQKWLYTNPQGQLTPMMTPAMTLVEGMQGVALGLPVFDSNSEIIGRVSVIFYPDEIIHAKLAPLLNGKEYSALVMQTDGLSLYDTDPEQQGKNLFTDPLYASYTELLAIGHRVAAESSGHGTYSFRLDAQSGEVVQKECFWTTINAYGQQWRLNLIRQLNS
ncbi:MAG: hypothetical protein ACQCN5_08045 [Candidatus Bathyarchaeia archaeon]